MTQSTNGGRPLWALAVVAFGIIDPIIAVAYPGSLPVEGAQTVDLATALPSAVIVGLLISHAIVLLIGYAIWRLLSAWRFRTVIPTILAMAGVAMVVVRFATIGGVA